MVKRAKTLGEFITNHLFVPMAVRSNQYKRVLNTIRQMNIFQCCFVNDDDGNDDFCVCDFCLIFNIILNFTYFSQLRIAH